MNYSQLNSVTKKDSDPLPQINATLDIFAERILFSTLELKSSY